MDGTKWTDAVKAMAPKAGSPSFGAGNVPNAPGVMSGQYRGQNTASPAKSLLGRLQALHGGMQARQAMAQSTQMHPADPQSQKPPQLGPQTGMSWTPDVQASIMQYLSEVLNNAGGKGYTLTTTGGTMKR